jgi:hypothetical protein
MKPALASDQDRQFVTMDCQLNDGACVSRIETRAPNTLLPNWQNGCERSKIKERYRPIREERVVKQVDR